MLRLIAGIVLGYLLFAFTTAFTALVFFISRAPDAFAEPAVMVATIGAGLIAAGVGGYVGGLLARGNELTAGLVIGALIAAGATVSLVVQPGNGAQWSQLPEFFMAPVAVLGAYIPRLRSRRTATSFGEASTKPR